MNVNVITKKIMTTELTTEMPSINIAMTEHKIYINLGPHNVTDLKIVTKTLSNPGQAYRFARDHNLIYDSIINDDNTINPIMKMISGSAKFTYKYCMNVLGRPLLGVPRSFLDDPKYAYMYCWDLLGIPSKTVEAIVADTEYHKKYLAKKKKYVQRLNRSLTSM